MKKYVIHYSEKYDDYVVMVLIDGEYKLRAITRTRYEAMQFISELKERADLKEGKEEC